MSDELVSMKEPPEGYESHEYEKWDPSPGDSFEGTYMSKRMIKAQQGPDTHFPVFCFDVYSANGAPVEDAPAYVSASGAYLATLMQNAEPGVGVYVHYCGKEKKKGNLMSVYQVFFK